MPTIESELYGLLEQGFEDERQGKIRPLSDAISDIRREINKSDRSDLNPDKRNN